MASEAWAEPVDGSTDANGKNWAIGVDGDDVIICADRSWLRLGAEECDRFAKAWAEAERRAEAHPQ